jgi:hypothetical protein
VKHSAKAVAKLAREREKDARRAGQAAAAPAARSVAPAARTVAPAANTVAPAASTVAPAASIGRQRLNQLPYALVLAGALVGLLLMRAGGLTVRGGTLVIAGALLAGSITRLVLPESRAGLLGSRRRLVDVAMLTALGVGLLIAGLVVQVSG